LPPSGSDRDQTKRASTTTTRRKIKAIYERHHGNKRIATEIAATAAVAKNDCGMEFSRFQRRLRVRQLSLLKQTGTQ